MKYCSNCGTKINKNAGFCSNCGSSLDNSKSNFKREGKIRYETPNHPLKSSSSGFWKAIIWIIVLLVLFFIIVSFISNQGNIGVSSSRDDSWWGTTHKSTSMGLGGVNTETHSCPFWNRNC